MKMYFHDDDAQNVFKRIKTQDWALVLEMEAATHYLSQLALVEVQSRTLLASSMVVFKMMADAQLNHDRSST